MVGGPKEHHKGGDKSKILPLLAGNGRETSKFPIREFSWKKTTKRLQLTGLLRGHCCPHECAEFESEKTIPADSAMKKMRL